jgi:broad specificity phosphatase PhoE
VVEGPVLALVRHSLPDVDPSRPAREWSLSAEGCRRARQFAACLAPYDLEVLACSEERKALQTAAIIGEELGLPVEVVPGLHEHDRSGAVGLDHEAFLDGVARMFAHPGERVFGAESADEARARFTSALGQLLARHPGRNLCAVAHGTVLSLFVAEQEGSDPYTLWRGLGLPCAFVLSRPDLRLTEWMPEAPRSCPGG